MDTLIDGKMDEQKMTEAERYRQAEEKWQAILQPLIADNLACEKITAEDLAITINCKG